LCCHCTPLGKVDGDAGHGAPAVSKEPCHGQLHGQHNLEQRDILIKILFKKKEKTLSCSPDICLQGARQEGTSRRLKMTQTFQPAGFALGVLCTYIKFLSTGPASPGCRRQGSAPCTPQPRGRAVHPLPAPNHSPFGCFSSSGRALAPPTLLQGAGSGALRLLALCHHQFDTGEE